MRLPHFFFIFLYLCMYAHIYRLMVAREDIGCPGYGVTGSYEPPNMGAGIQTTSCQHTQLLSPSQNVFKFIRFK